MSKPDDDEPFLSRWSRRKRGSDREKAETVAGKAQGATDEPGPAALDASGPTDRVAEAEPEEPLDLATLPRVEELTAESDIAVFLDKRVPAMLRNAALSRMWTLDPTIRDFIEVAENQWNWNIPGGAPFYEEMLPGEGAGTLFADATSAIARTLEQASPSQEVAAGTSSFENHLQENVDQIATEDAAAHQIAAPAPASIRVGSRAEPVEAESVTVGHHADAAVQQECGSGLPRRRRHGGALPA